MGATANEPAQNEEEIIEQPNAEQVGSSTQRPAGQSEGAASEPSAAEIKELYEATGVTAPVPTGKAKGRPKTSDVRAEDDKKNGAGSSNSEQKGRNTDNKNESKNASNSNNDDDSGNSSDSKGSKNKSDDDGVQDESGEADREFAELNPEMKKILSEDAKKTLSGELQEMNQPNMTRTEKRKANRMMKKLLKDQESPTQPSSSDSKS